MNPGWLKRALLEAIAEKEWMQIFRKQIAQNHENITCLALKNLSGEKEKEKSKNI